MTLICFSNKKVSQCWPQLKSSVSMALALCLDVSTCFAMSSILPCPIPKSDRQTLQYAYYVSPTPNFVMTGVRQCFTVLFQFLGYSPLNVKFIKHIIRNSEQKWDFMNLSRVGGNMPEKWEHSAKSRKIGIQICSIQLASSDNQASECL